jgi:hypothetical protein
MSSAPVLGAAPTQSRRVSRVLIGGIGAAAPEPPVEKAHVIGDPVTAWAQSLGRSSPHVAGRPRGEACRIRYAAECVWACERPPEAARCDTRLGQRVGQFGRALAAEQPRVMPFRRPPPAPQTRVACLGVACRGDQDRAGQDHGTRRPARKKRRHSLQRFTLGCRENRTLRLGVLLARLKAKLRGYDHDDGVAGNVAGLKPCFSPARGSLQTWRNVNRQLTQHLAVLRCCCQAATSWRRVSRVSAGPNIVPRGR